jgi:phage terminase large subunit-like protein
MSAEPVFDPEAFRHWNTTAQEQAAAALRKVQGGGWHPFFCPLGRSGVCDGRPHGPVPPDPAPWDFPHARADQHPPRGSWLTWLLRGGRGSGKTRTGSEWTHRRTKVSPRVALIAPTGPDARDIMIEGESGLLSTAPPGGAPQWEPSKRKLTWPNGAIGSVYSGEEPDRLRGPEHYDAWIDEPAHTDLIEAVWDNLLLGLRLGPAPRVCATTTPKPTPWMRTVVGDPTTVSVVTTTYANLDNLAPPWRAMVLARYEGTRKGRQELLGEILTEVEGAMWQPSMIDDHRVAVAPPLTRIVVGADPAGAVNRRSDETGIVVVGRDEDGDLYVLADHSARYSPQGWATQIGVAYDGHHADRAVVERNYGGDMVRTTLASVRPDIAVTEVTSRRGKALRADPIAALYEQGRVHHVGVFNELEDQMTSWVLGETSPDRLDALVHGLTHLASRYGPSEVATAANLPRLPR